MKAARKRDAKGRGEEVPIEDLFRSLGQSL